MHLFYLFSWMCLWTLSIHCISKETLTRLLENNAKQSDFLQQLYNTSSILQQQIHIYRSALWNDLENKECSCQAQYQPHWSKIVDKVLTPGMHWLHQQKNHFRTSLASSQNQNHILQSIYTNQEAHSHFVNREEEVKCVHS